MQLLTRKEWDDAWAKLDAATEGKSMNEAAEIVNQLKAKLAKQYEGVDFSNARYVVHVESFLKSGGKVPQEVLDSITFADARFDSFAFKKLGELIDFKAMKAGA